MNIEELAREAEYNQVDFGAAALPVNHESMIQERIDGPRRGESCRVPSLSDMMVWKRGFQYCWTGHPNFGKSEIIMQMALIKSLYDKWKWCIWTPEMISADGKRVVNANDVYNQLVLSMTGKTTDRVFAAKYGTPLIDDEEYKKARHFISQHFLVINPKDRRYKSLIKHFYHFWETYGFDGFIADPFKNLKHDTHLRWDVYLDEVFSEVNEFAIETDSVFNWIAHPKADANYRENDGSYKVCTAQMLSGGASWNNNMDAILSIHRPNVHTDFKDPRVELYALKWRKQMLTARQGVCYEIDFEFKTGRYLFEGISPIVSYFKQGEQRGLELEIKPA